MKDCSTCRKKPKIGTPYEKTPCMNCDTKNSNFFILPEIIRDESILETKLSVLKKLAILSNGSTIRIACELLKNPKITSTGMAQKYEISKRQAIRIKNKLKHSFPEIFS